MLLEAASTEGSRKRRSHIALGLLGLASVLCGRPAAADVFCAGNGPSHDAPNGYLIMSRSNGITQGLMNAIGEQRTHTMLSTSSWITHATMSTPGTQSSVPHIDPTQLQFGQPGASQIQPAALYAFLYSGGGLQWVHKQTADLQPNGLAEEQTVADWFWNTTPYSWVPNKCTGGGVVYGGTFYDCNGNLQTASSATCGGVNCQSALRAGPGSCTCNMMTGGGYYALGDVNATEFHHMTYDLSQFSNIGWSAEGAVASGHGVVCSTLAAYGVANSLRQLSPFQYSPQQSSAGLVGVINEVYNECGNGVNWFDSGVLWLGSLFGISSSASTKCHEASYQVANCMIGNSCSLSTQPSGMSGAFTISPDDISGWRPNQNWQDFTHNGPWSDASTDSPLNFNTSGTTYACWGNG